MEKINLAFICPDIGIDFGRTKVIHELIGYFVKKEGIKVFLITNKESNLELFEGYSITIVFIPIGLDRRNPFYFMASLVSLFKIVKLFNITLLHSHHRYSDLIVYFVSKITDIKTVSTVHSYVYGKKNISFLLDEIICVSESIKKHIINEFNVNKSKLKVIYNGINSGEVKKIIQKGVNNKNKNKFNILCVGRFDFEKGQDLLLQAMEKVWKLNDKILLTLIGDFSRNIVKVRKDKRNEQKNFKSTFKKLLENNFDKIKITSSVSTPWNEIEKADIIVIPSRIEAFGLVALEAGILKKCVVASDTGGLKEIINNNINGISFKSESVDDLAANLILLLNNVNLISIFGQKLYYDVISKFSLKQMGNNYFALYKKLLEK